MAVIVQTAASSSAGPYQITETALTSGTDTLTFSSGTNQELQLRNPTGSPIAITVKGVAPVNPVVAGTGTTFDVSGGKVITVTAGNMFAVSLDKISAYLGNTTTVNITGGNGAFASLVA